MKQINTLIEDIHKVLDTGDGWTNEIAEWVANETKESLNRQLGQNRYNPKPSLRPSNIGTPCLRQLWYKFYRPDEGEPIRPTLRSRFIFGDLTEAYILGLVQASGHRFGGYQDSVGSLGIKGTRDCVIDGYAVDVKSASPGAMRKFYGNGLLKDDAFGYLWQATAYLHACQDDPLVEHKNHFAFLAFNKASGEMVLDIYDLTDYLATYKLKLETLRGAVNPVDKPKGKVSQVPPELPERAFEDIEETHYRKPTGNRKLCMQCSYCDFKELCWDGLKFGMKGSKPVYYTYKKEEF